MSKIPKNLIQTNMKKPENHILQKLSEFFIGWNYKNYETDEEIINFFQKNPIEDFPDIINRFNILKGPHKSDLFRYYYLYLFGGCYLDDDTMVYENINKIIKDYDSVFIKSNFFDDFTHIFNRFICTYPKNPILYEAIKHLYTVDYSNARKKYQFACKELYNIIQKLNPKNIKIYEETLKIYEEKNKSIIYGDNNEIILIHYFQEKKIPKVLIDSNMNIFYGFWDSNDKINDIQLKQIKMWAKSILYFNRGSKVILYTKENIIDKNKIIIDGLVIKYFKDYSYFTDNTPLYKIKNLNNVSKPELSDIIRLTLLYKNGGTWLDIDNIVVRKFPDNKNIIGTFLWENNKKQATYFGSTFNLVNGNKISEKYKNFNFHIQNDPMINWEKGHSFLYKWMTLIYKYTSNDWGQKIPTDILLDDSNIDIYSNITLLPQHDLLLHPAFGCNKQFGYPDSKGPIFPPYDLKISGKNHYDSYLTKDEFWNIVKQTLQLSSYCCVKNSKNIGIKQNIDNKEKKWFIGYLCNFDNFDNILSQFKNYDNNSFILFDYKQKIPYKNYNCSIYKLNRSETKNITNNIHNENSILIIFFVSAPNNFMGSMSWIGLISYDIFINNTKKNIWLIKPHLLQNDKGPKCADLRIFNTKNNLGIIGYSRVAPESNTPNIADYYVRVSLLGTRLNNSLYNKVKNEYNFINIDGGCFPEKIKNNYKKFQIENDDTKIQNIEFYIQDNIYSKEIYPHKSKNILMPSKLKLNGIEVSFSKNNRNENPSTHISSKNIIPLQHKNYLDNIGCFVDVSPHNKENPIITIQNLTNGNVYHTDNLYIDKKFNSKHYRGSTPFIELNSNIWITMTHKRYYNNKNLKYDYYFVFYSSKEVIINNNIINIPDKCIKELKFYNTFLENEFLFITGLIVDEEIYNYDTLNLSLLLSYGISDMRSGICKYNLQIYSKDIKEINNQLMITSICDTRILKKQQHSSTLLSNEKCDVKKGDIFKVLQENSDYYIVERPNSLLHNNWFVLKNHFCPNECIFTNDNNVIIKLINHTFSNQFKNRDNHEIIFRRINTYLINNNYINNNIIDLGAWIGDNSIPWSKNLKNSTIYAIDPSIDNINYIKNMCLYNKISNIKCINKAISDVPSLLSTNDNINHCSFVRDNLGISGKIKVKSESLDNLYKNNIIKNIDYIHLDVEGMEYKVIVGSKNIIDIYKPIITFEQHINKDNYYLIINFLKKYNYECYLIDEILPGCRLDCRNFISFPNKLSISILVNNINKYIGKNILIKY